jgi:hypothetical protein
MRRASVQKGMIPINPEHTQNALKYRIVKPVAVPRRHRTEFVTGVMLVLVKNRAKFGVILVIVVATKKIVVLAEINQRRLYIKLKTIKNCI